MEFGIEQILKAVKLNKNSPNVKIDEDRKILCILHEKIYYAVQIRGDIIFIDCRREMIQPPNYKLLSDINNQINMGVHKIESGEYYFELILRIAGVKNLIEELPLYIDYVKRHAYQGYQILNTTSEAKRRKLLQAHEMNIDLE